METRIIELNRATPDDLLEKNMKGLDEKHVADLIEYRDQYGPFETWEEVMDVPGFNQELVDRMQAAGMTLGAIETDFSDASPDEFT